MVNNSCLEFGSSYRINQRFVAGNPLTGTLANSEDPDEMPHNAAFHQGLHCLLLINLIIIERNTIFFFKL